MLPVEVTDEDLQQNPEFSQLLSLLSQHINSDGTSSQLEKDLQQVSYYKFMNEMLDTSAPGHFGTCVIHFGTKTNRHLCFFKVVLAVASFWSLFNQNFLNLLSYKFFPADFRW